MTLQLDSQDISQFIVIGDKVLIKPTKNNDRTKSGLYLPPSVKEKEKLSSGYVLKTGPGYAIPNTDMDEAWKEENKEPKYIPLQTKEGDLAIYMQNTAMQIQFNNEKYAIVPYNAILMLIRDDELFN